METSTPTIESEFNDNVERLRVIHELVEDYRTSNDYTMARAHITLFKIDEIITTFDSLLETKIKGEDE